MLQSGKPQTFCRLYRCDHARFAARVSVQVRTGPTGAIVAAVVVIGATIGGAVGLSLHLNTRAPRKVASATKVLALRAAPRPTTATPADALDKTAVAEAAEAPVAAPITDADCSSAIRLVGVIANPRPEHSVAMIDNGAGRRGMYGRGQYVDSFLVSSVGSDKIELRRGSSRCELALFSNPRPWGEPTAEAEVEPSEEPTTSAEDALVADRAAEQGPPDPPIADEVRTQVSKTGLNEFVIERAMLERLRSSGRMRTQGLEVRAFSRNGIEGALVVGLTPNTPLGILGVQNGDILQSANGRLIRTEDDLLGLADSLTSLKRISIRVNRRGTPTVLHWNVR